MRILITGAGRGLGLEMARACIARGHSVGATVRDRATAHDLGELAAHHRGRVVLCDLDIAQSDRIDSAVAGVAAELGGLDIVINNAGVNAMSLPGARGTLSLQTLTAEPMLEMFRINSVAPILVARAALPWLRQAENPRIVNISSWIGAITTTTYSGNYAYAASKAALNMASRVMANELRDDGVTVVALNPGWVRTSMGGTRAELAPEDAAAGIVSVAEGLVPAQSGRFLQWDGTEHAW